MAEGTKVGEAYIEIKANTDQAVKGLDDVRRSFKETANSAGEAGANVERAVGGFGQSLNGARRQVTEANNAVFGLVRSIGSLIAAAVASAAAGMQLRKWIEGTGEAASNTSADLDTLSAKIDKLNMAAATEGDPLLRELIAIREGYRALQEEIDTTAVKRSAALAKEVGLLGRVNGELDIQRKRLEENTEIIRRRAQESRVRDENAARDRAAKAEAERLQKIDADRMRAAESAAFAFLTAREEEEKRIVRDVLALEAQLRALGLDELAQRVRDEGNARIDQIKAEERARLDAEKAVAEARERADAEARARAEALIETMLEGIRRIAEEQARRAAKLPDGLSAGSGEEATKLLRKIARATSASRYSGYTGVGTAAF